MYRIKTSAAFDSAHFLAGYDGKCANIHGHRWIIEAEFKSNELVKEGPRCGMLVDFGDVKNILRDIAKIYDHSMIFEENTLRPATIAALNDENFKLIPVPFRPTAENFSKHFYDLLKQRKLPVSRVTVYETPKNCAIYEED